MERERERESQWLASRNIMPSFPVIFLPSLAHAQDILLPLSLSLSLSPRLSLTLTLSHNIN